MYAVIPARSLFENLPNGKGKYKISTFKLVPKLLCISNNILVSRFERRFYISEGQVQSRALAGVQIAKFQPNYLRKRLLKSVMFLYNKRLII